MNPNQSLPTCVVYLVDRRRPKSTPEPEASVTDAVLAAIDASPEARLSRVKLQEQLGEGHGATRVGEAVDFMLEAGALKRCPGRWCVVARPA